MNDKLLNTTEQIFISLDGLDHLMGKFNDVKNKISFTELYAYASQPGYKASAELLQALGSDLSLRRDFNRLLEKETLAHFDQMAAASTDEVNHRECDGFELSLSPSLANLEQTYLIIKSLDPNLCPKLLFILLENQPPLRLEIEDFYDGEAQILLSSQDDIVKGLRNLKSDVILR